MTVLLKWKYTQAVSTAVAEQGGWGWGGGGGGAGEGLVPPVI